MWGDVGSSRGRWGNVGSCGGPSHPPGGGLPQGRDYIGLHLTTWGLHLTTSDYIGLHSTGVGTTSDYIEDPRTKTGPGTLLL